MPQEKYQSSGLRPRRRWASVTEPSGRAVVYQGHCAVTTSFEGRQFPCPRCLGQAAKNPVGLKAGVGYGEGRNGRRINSPPTQGRRKLRKRGGNFSSINSESTVRPLDCGRFGICTRRQEGSVGRNKKELVRSNESLQKGFFLT